MKKLFEYLLCLIYPDRCIFCEELTDPLVHLCDECENSLPYITGETCPFCGEPVDECDCKKRSRYFERTESVFYYENTVKNCIKRFKFGGYKHYSAKLAELLAETCRQRYGEIDFDYVTYVPMYSKKQRARGFNQSELLAKHLSDRLNISFGENMLVKLYNTNNQHDCSAVERTGNLTGVFDVNDEYDINGKTVLLIDDIKTTGVTLSECGKMLYLNGAERVFCLTVALRKSKIKE